MLSIALRSCQELGMILVNKVVLKLKLPKNISNKKGVLLNSYYSLKKNLKDLDNLHSFAALSKSGMILVNKVVLKLKLPTK